MIVAFFIFFVTLSMDVLGDFIEIVLPSLWNINISIFLLSFSLLGDSRDTDWLLHIFCFFFSILLLVSWWRLGMFEVEFMLIIPFFDLMI